MAKNKSLYVFVCNECGHESSKWMGQCPMCKAWNSFSEEKIPEKSKKVNANNGRLVDKPILISEVSVQKEDRILTGMKEFDRVLGGGLVPGSLTLLGGDPGIGKSTLLLQVCKELSDRAINVLYISGEESAKQIKMRANRIGEFKNHFYLYCETDIERIENQILHEKPQIVIIDSIQTISNAELAGVPGSVSQVRDATAIFLQIAKQNDISIFIVGHVTKEGTVAGPRMLEHMVDAVLYVEGDGHTSYRILRGVKNRFGATNEIGVFEMGMMGLQEVENPSAYMLQGKPENASGSVVTCSLEGTRPILIEVQALVCDTNFNIPRRQATGTDFNRLNLLMAVVEKRVGIRLSQSDAYINVAGGMRVNEPAIDLAMVLAIVSSHRNIVIEQTMVVFGEVGLSGEVRSISQIQPRLLEAKKLGYSTCMIPKNAEVGVEIEGSMKIIRVSSIIEAIQYL